MRTQTSSLPGQRGHPVLFLSLVFCLLCVTDMKHNPFACFFCVNLTRRMGCGTSCSPSAFCRKVEKEFNKWEFLFLSSLFPTHSKPQHYEGISCREGTDMPLTKTQSFLVISAITTEMPLAQTTLLVSSQTSAVPRSPGPAPGSLFSLILIAIMVKSRYFSITEYPEGSFISSLYGRHLPKICMQLI